MPTPGLTSIFKPLVAALKKLLGAPAPTHGSGVQGKFQEQFGELAKDKAGFHRTMRSVFGAKYDVQKAEGFREAALKGDFSWAPPVKYATDAEMKGAMGAYDANSGVVYLNEKLKRDPSGAMDTYVEEAGHHLDAKLNQSDTKGDEGELFRRTLNGEAMTQKDIADIRAENDKGTITVDGKELSVEFRDPKKEIKQLMKGYDPEDCDADDIAEKITKDPELVKNLTKEQRLALVRGLFDGPTSEGEEDAAMKILMQGTTREELVWLKKKVGWSNLCDELDTSDLKKINRQILKKKSGDSSSLDQVLEKGGVAKPQGMETQEIRDAIAKKLDGMSQEDLEKFADDLLDPKSRAALLKEFSFLRRTGQLSQARSDAMVELLRALSDRVGSADTKSKLDQLRHRVIYTQRVVGNLEEGDYQQLLQIIPDLFDPDLSPEQRWALYETLKKVEPEIRAMQDVIAHMGTSDQKTAMNRFMNVLETSMGRFLDGDGQINDGANVIQDLLGALGAVGDSFDDFQAFIGQTVAQLGDDLTGLIPRLLFGDSTSDDQARELAGMLAAKAGPDDTGTSYLAYIPFDLKVQMINAMLDGPTLDQDEHGILLVLRETKRNNPQEFYQLVEAVGYDRLDDDIDGSEWDEFLALMNE